MGLALSWRRRGRRVAVGLGSLLSSHSGMPLRPPQRYSGILYILVAITALVGVVYAVLAALTCLVGGTITGGLFRMSNLALWALMCAQVRWRLTVYPC